MSNMENAHSEDMQFDDIDLISASLAQQVPPQKPVQTVAEFLQSVIVKDSLPKEDLRRSWNNKKSEREKLMKQWNKAKKTLAYWVSNISRNDSQVYMFIVFLAGWWVILLDFIFESNNRKLHCY